MTKGQIRKSISDLDKLSEEWIKFRRFFYPETLTPEVEAEFSQIKTYITSSHRAFISLLEFDVEIAQTMLDSIGRINSPRGGENLTMAALKNLESEWNNAYLLIQETIGLLVYRLEEKSNLWNPVNLFRKMFSKSQDETEIVPTYGKTRVGRRRTISPLFKLIMVLIGLGIVLGILWEQGILQDYLP